MSKRKEIKEVTINLLQDGKVHTIEEIYKACMEKNITSPEDKGSVRTAVFNLKKENKNFIAVDKGKYKLDKKDKAMEDEKNELEKAIVAIEEKIKALKKINWITCTDAELQAARAEINLIKKLSSVLNGFIHTNSRI